MELVPKRVLDLSPIRAATEVLGTKMAFPILVSPSSGHGMLHPDGESATAAGSAGASNTPFIVSSGSSVPFEKLAASELVQAMAYTGRPTLASLDRTIVRTDFP